MKCDSCFEIRLYLTGFAKKKRAECLLLVMGFIFGKPFQIAPYLKVRIFLKQNLKALTFKNTSKRELGNHLKLLLTKNPVPLTLLLKKSNQAYVSHRLMSN